MGGGTRNQAIRGALPDGIWSRRILRAETAVSGDELSVLRGRSTFTAQSIL
jgi:hypothetical protein